MTRPSVRALARADSAPAGFALLWAPWRAAYISKMRRPSPRCVFCFGRLNRSGHRKRLVLYAGPLAVVMLNRYPYANGHLMIAPRRHAASPELLNRAERGTLAELVALAVERVREVFHPDGLNVGANLGRAAGAGFADHLHWHVVPRWNGDNNFMPVVGAARVLSQSLQESFDVLAPHFKAIETALS